MAPVSWKAFVSSVSSVIKEMLGLRCFNMSAALFDMEVIPLDSSCIHRHDDDNAGDDDDGHAPDYVYC